MGTKEIYRSVVKELRVETGGIKMAMDSFMRSVNSGEKCPEDSKEATAVLMCKNTKQQTQQEGYRSVSLTPALGTAWELCRDQAWEPPRKAQKEIHFVFPFFFLSICAIQLNYPIKNN